MCVWQSNGQWKKHLIHGQAQDSLQTLELAAVTWALATWKDQPLNVASDSQYAVGVVQRIEDALLKPPKNPRLGELFLQVRQAIRLRTARCCIIHIRSHQTELGLAEGNAVADSLITDHYGCQVDGQNLLYLL